MIILFCVAIWLTSGFIAAGFLNARAAYEKIDTTGRMGALYILIALGPFFLIGEILERDYKHGWRKWW